MKILAFDNELYGLSFLLMNMPEETELLEGEIAGIGTKAAQLFYRTDPSKKFEIEIRAIESLEQAIEWVFELLIRDRINVITHRNEIACIAHRVVHGGGVYTEPTQLNDQVLECIAEFAELAPFHNSYNLKMIRASLAVFPQVSQYAVFDTAFFSSLPPKAYTYGISYALTKKYNIRRYGFHGICHRDLTRRMAALMNGAPEDFKLITCQLGHGCSMAAVDRGKPIDTSMGFSPAEGLIMERRSGDIDPEIIFYLMHKEEMTPADLNLQLNKFSGLYGMSGGLDLKAILKRADKGDEIAVDALETYCYRIQKYIGSYYVALGGLDGIVITGIDVKYFPNLRKRLFKSLECIGVKLDEKKTEELCDTKEGIISSPDSRIKVAYVLQQVKHSCIREAYAALDKTGNE